MIRLAAFDIDRTLIDPKQGEIAPETADAILRLQKNGIKTVIASGRHRHLISEDIQALDFDYYILRNGSYVTDREGNILCQETMDDNVVQRLVQEMIRKELPINLHYVAGIAPGNPKQDLAQMMQAYREKMNIVRKPPKVTHRIIDRPEGERPVSCQAYIPAEQRPYFIDLFPQLEFLPVFEGPMCDINKAGVSKGTALERICSATGIPLSEAIAFGDDRNDLEMVSLAGIGVAMSNGIQEVKDVADYITAPCMQLGVVRALEHFGLLEM